MTHRSTLGPQSSVLSTELVAAELRRSAEIKLWAAEHLAADIARAGEMIVAALGAGGKVLFCGNGGSAADSQHLAAELVGRFKLERVGLAAIALTTDSSILTALANDYGYDRVFARQVEALGRPGDVLVGISTSGRSPSVNEAVQVARRLGLATIALTGRDGGKLAELVDRPVIVHSDDVARIQECHIAIGHALCGLVDAAFEPGVMREA